MSIIAYFVFFLKFDLNLLSVYLKMRITSLIELIFYLDHGGVFSRLASL